MKKCYPIIAEYIDPLKKACCLIIIIWNPTYCVSGSEFSVVGESNQQFVGLKINC